MSNGESLSGKVALVTGASSGIGLATAKAFAREGSNVSIAARREKRLEELAGELEEKWSVEVLTVPTDVRKENQVVEMVEKTVNKLGSLDILVNNAGVGSVGNVENMSTEDYRRIMETNLDGPFFATRASLKHLRESKGHLVFIASLAGQYPRPEIPVYAASKWGIRGFALSLEASLGRNGVAVTIINPSEVRTEIGRKDDKPFIEKFDVGEVTEPEEIAEAVIFSAKQTNSTLSEIDIYRRDKLSDTVR